MKIGKIISCPGNEIVASVCISGKPLDLKIARKLHGKIVFLEDPKDSGSESRSGSRHVSRHGSRSRSSRPRSSGYSSSGSSGPGSVIGRVSNVIGLVDDPYLVITLPKRRGASNMSSDKLINKPVYVKWSEK